MVCFYFIGFFPDPKRLSASAVFSPSGCELSASAVNHSNTGEITPSKNAIYLEKMCIPEKLALSK